MKKISILLLIAIVMISMVACAKEKYTLHCDGENCDNLVELEVEEGVEPDESWIVFCQTCADTVLED